MIKKSFHSKHANKATKKLIKYEKKKTNLLRRDNNKIKVIKTEDND